MFLQKHTIALVQRRTACAHHTGVLYTSSTAIDHAAYPYAGSVVFDIVASKLSHAVVSFYIDCINTSRRVCWMNVSGVNICRTPPWLYKGTSFSPNSGTLNLGFILNIKLFSNRF